MCWQAPAWPDSVVITKGGKPAGYDWVYPHPKPGATTLQYIYAPHVGNEYGRFLAERVALALKAGMDGFCTAPSSQPLLCQPALLLPTFCHWSDAAACRYGLFRLRHVGESVAAVSPHLQPVADRLGRAIRGQFLASEPGCWFSPAFFCTLSERRADRTPSRRRAVGRRRWRGGRWT